jgi:hypothetical protein
MKERYFEKQVHGCCFVHCVNNLFQRVVLTNLDMQKAQKHWKAACLNRKKYKNTDSLVLSLLSFFVYPLHSSFLHFSLSYSCTFPLNLTFQTGNKWTGWTPEILHLALSQKGFILKKVAGPHKFSRIQKTTSGKYICIVQKPKDLTKSRHAFGIDLDSIYPVIVDSFNELPLFFDRHNFLYSVWDHPPLLKIIYEIKTLSALFFFSMHVSIPCALLPFPSLVVLRQNE